MSFNPLNIGVFRQYSGLSFGTSLVDAQKLKFVPHAKDEINKRRLSKQKVLSAVEKGDAYWNSKQKRMIVYEAKEPGKITSKDIAVVIKDKSLIMTAMDVDPGRWKINPANPKDLIHISRKGNETNLKNIEP